MAMRFWSFLLALTWALTLPTLSTAQNKQKKPAQKRTKWDDMDIGPFQAYGLETKLNGKLWRPALKGLNIKLGPNASVCFDTERLRMAASWTGGFLKLPSGRDGLEGVPNIIGTLAFRTTMAPGWAGPKGEWVEPTPPILKGNDVYSMGPLPREWAKWRGHYTHGDHVVLSYSVGASGVLECPGFANGIFTRQFEITRSPAKSPMSLLVCEVAGAQGKVDGNVATLEKDGVVTGAAVMGTGVELKIQNGRIVAEVKSLQPTSQFIIGTWSGPKAEVKKLIQFPTAKRKMRALSDLTKGGKAKWNKPVTTRGRLGLAPGAYVVDTITVPEQNPWKSWIRCSGFDFFKDGTTAAMCSVTGDVWIVSGIDESLKELKWRRYATGLFQPLGLKIVDEQIYVLGRDQITRFHDFNKDGEADFYENFNNDISISNHYHEYCLNLSTDPAGNFYFIKGGNLRQATVPHHGCLVKVSKDGSQLEVVATGHRAPNGMSVGPNGELTSADNEGNWVPASRVNLVKPGGFYGHVYTAHRKQVPTDYDKPLLWLPHQMDNSSGGQVWVTGDKWGPFKGDLLHLSYGKSSLFKVMKEEINGQWQGGAVRFPLRFDSGIMRGRFNNRDGQLYVVGLRVWQSNGARFGAFHRVRYTGKPVHMPTAIKVQKTSLAITFTNPLEAVSAVDDQNWAIDQWNYQWTKNYGSKMYSIKNPAKVVGDKKQGEFGGDVIAIKAIKLSADKKTVFIEIAGLKPVMQSRIRFNIKAADGTVLKQELFHTINRVPAQ
jgi:glucose/arabinose dehydrogenase